MTEITLPQIARRIADANDIMNPLDIPVGKVLKVPSINE